MLKNLPAMQKPQKMWVQSLDQEDPLEGDLQYSFLENPMDRGAWWAMVHRGHKESDRTERLTLSLS